MSYVLDKVNKYIKETFDDLGLKNMSLKLLIIILIGTILYFVVFAMKTKTRYEQIRDLIEMENFQNKEDSRAEKRERQKDLLKKLNIDDNDIEMVKKKKFKNMPLSDKPSRIEIVQSDDIYDKYYSSVYDLVAFDLPKVLYEHKYIESLCKKISNNKRDINILDIGCGTGQHGKLLAKDYNYTGVDRSKHMLNIAKDKIDVSAKIVLSDANKLSAAGEDTYNIILCLYFTIYYFKDLNKIFNNFSRWIKDDGYLILHLVDKDLFDPVLNPANPSLVNSIQKYSKNRITNSIINFNNVTYISDFVLKKNNIAEFQEVIRFKDTNVERRQSHILYMYTNKHFVNMAKKYGFMLEEIKNLDNVKFEHNYLFVFKKVRKE